MSRAGASLRGGRAAVLDGVIAVLDARGPAGSRRDSAAASPPARRPRLSSPPSTSCFDVLHLDGRPVTGWPLERRVDALSASDRSGDVLQAPDHVRGRASALAAAASARSLPGTARAAGERPYRPGSPRPTACGSPLVEQTTCVIAGIVARRLGGTRLILGEHVAGPSVFAGQVDGPRDKLVAALARAAGGDLDSRRRAARRRSAVDATWLRPALTATVRHQGRSRAGVAASAGSLAVRDDVDPRWCVQPPAGRGPRRSRRRTRFSPTLLVPLPLGDAARPAPAEPMTGAVLMCRPDHFGIEYEINPWMHVAVQVDHALAAAQWEALHRTYIDLGVEVELAAPVAGLPDMVFTANAAVLWDDRAVLSNFHHAERQGEEAHWRQELERLDFDVHELPRSLSFEGAGDALFVGDRLFCGYGFRTDRDAHRPVARILEVEVVSLELVDPRFYHLDTCFCPLDATNVLAAPDAFAPASMRS